MDFHLDSLVFNRFKPVLRFNLLRLENVCRAWKLSPKSLRGQSPRENHKTMKDRSQLIHIDDITYELEKRNEDYENSPRHQSGTYRMGKIWARVGVQGCGAWLPTGLTSV